MTTLALPPPLEALDTERFRQKLAGLIDPRETLDEGSLNRQKDQAIAFVATLPMLFGDSLDRTKMWDRIASAIQTAHAKTAGDDHEFFVAQVLEHVKASHAKAARSMRLARTLDLLRDSTTEERQAWMTFLATHLYAVLVHARAEWERYKAARAAKQSVEFWGESEVDDE